MSGYCSIETCKIFCTNCDQNWSSAFSPDAALQSDWMILVVFSNHNDSSYFFTSIFLPICSAAPKAECAGTVATTSLLPCCLPQAAASSGVNTFLLSWFITLFFMLSKVVIQLTVRFCWWACKCWQEVLGSLEWFWFCHLKDPITHPHRTLSWAGFHEKALT